ncbi:MAG: hypothetical protein AB1489_07710 [Acidobacteriota bacterium]
MTCGLKITAEMRREIGVPAGAAAVKEKVDPAPETAPVKEPSRWLRLLGRS